MGRRVTNGRMIISGSMDKLPLEFDAKSQLQREASKETAKIKPMSALIADIECGEEDIE